MALAVTLFLAIFAFTFVNLALVRAFGATDVTNTLGLSTGVGFILAVTTVFGAAAFAPLPLCFFVFVLVYHYDLPMGRSVAIIALLVMLAYGIEHGLAPLIDAMFNGPPELD